MSIRSLSVSFILCSLVFQQTLLPVRVVYAEDVQQAYDDDYADLDDYFDNPSGQIAYYYAETPSPTLKPTFSPTQSPTKTPTLEPTLEPTRGGDDFYEIDTDDGYTAEAQSARIYYSSVSDVILCLIMTFFWVLWLVGTIFPTKIHYMYKTEGVVVKGYVVESYTSSSAADAHTQEIQMQMMDMQMDMDMDMDMDMVGGKMEAGTGTGIVNAPSKDSSSKNNHKDQQVNNFMSGEAIVKNSSSNDFEMDTMDELDIPIYHAIVSYVVPGRVATGLRRRLRKAPPLVPLSPVAEDYILHGSDEEGGRPSKPIETDFTRNNSAGIRPPRSPHRFIKLQDAPPSPTLSCVPLDGNGNMKETKNGINLEVDTTAALSPRSASASATKRPSLLDIYSSFDTVHNTWKDNDKGYYKYNHTDDSDYDTPIGEDEYEDDPEHIGNLFYQFGLFPTPKRKVKPAEPVRVKKRFETNQLLDPGRDDIEILVLPGNPGSGLLKSDFEQEEYQLNNGVSKDDDAFGGIRMGDRSTGIIGIVLAAVSVIGAVNGVLTLPFVERGCKFSLCCVVLCCAVLCCDVYKQVLTALDGIDAECNELHTYESCSCFFTFHRWLGNSHY